MKNVLLIGDSIRIGATGSPGYGVFVKESLKDEAFVWGPEENCRFAQYTLRNLCDWKAELAKAGVEAADVSVVHWNNGLWDLLRLDGDEPLTPEDMYLLMLERVYQKIRLYFPNAKVIFALTTAVPEKRQGKNFMRMNCEIDAYNESVKALMARLGVEVNDLHTITKGFDESMYSDSVHFTEEACRILADAVTAKIRASL